MKVKIMLLIMALVIPVKEYAQTAIDRMIAVKPGQTISMHFDYPELIRVTSWDGNEISIQGEVSINGGENDDAFILETTTADNVVRINSEIRDLKKLPHRIIIMHGGQKIMFKNKAEFQKYQAEHGRNYSSTSWGPDIDIQLEIRVPRNIETSITSVYGMVEVSNFVGPLDVESTYGGVDAALIEGSIGELTAETNYGSIYTNLDIKFADDQLPGRDFYTHVTAKPGKGPRYNFESTYGNVYLRKASNN